MAAPSNTSESTLTLNAQAEPWASLPSICVQLAQAKARKGLTYEEIGKAIGRDEVWVAAVFYAQAKLTTEEIAKLSEVLEVDKTQLTAELGPNWFPRRGLGPMPPTDPVLYRLYEGILVYGHAIKAVVHEKFGDGIISMIDCTVKIEKKPDPKGDRAVLTFDGKYLKYATW